MRQEKNKRALIQPVFAANGPLWLMELRLLLFPLLTLTKMKGRPSQAQTGADWVPGCVPALHLSASHGLWPRQAGP